MTSTTAAVTAGACSLSFRSSPLLHSATTWQPTFRPTLRFLISTSAGSGLSSERRSSISDHTTPVPTPNINHGRLQKEEEGGSRSTSMAATPFMEEEDEVSLSEFFELAKSLVGSTDGPPRWFSPLVFSSRLFCNCPLLLYLPGQSSLT